MKSTSATRSSKSLLAAAIGLLATTTFVQAAELPIGDNVTINGMYIGAIYLQAVKMKPTMPGMDGDIHLEADIHAAKGNKNGFGAGEWMPYLSVAFHLTKQGSNWTSTGDFIPMVASDGPHYGANVKMDGPGKYHVIYEIYPPSYNGFARHFDKETGVAVWWKPFKLEWDFMYLGTGKKGGY
jgi:uncharacterized protein involved in high-affinity Fe2+ transport